MRLRNGKHGYGAVTKSLHWLTLALLIAQFVVGYTMDAEADFREAECDPAGEDRSGGDTTDAREERLDRAEERCEAQEERAEAEVEDGYAVFDGSFDLLDVHVLLGVAIIAVACGRVVWRMATPLPPWDPRLSYGDRKVLPWVERLLLALLFLIPVTGLALIAGSDDLLPLHVAAHVCFYLALAAHVFIVLRRRVLGRMLPGRPRQAVAEPTAAGRP